MMHESDDWADLPPPQAVDIGHGRQMWISKRPDLYPGGHIAVDLPDGSTRWFASERMARDETLPPAEPKTDGRKGIRSPRVAAALAELGHTPKRGEMASVARKYGMLPQNLRAALLRHSASGAM